MQRASRYRSAADVLSGFMRSRGLTNQGAAVRLALPVGTLKAYLAGTSAPEVDSPQWQALKVWLPSKVFDRYWKFVEQTRTHTAPPSFGTIERLLESGRLGEADVHLTTLMDTDAALASPAQYASLAIRLGRRCLDDAAHRRKRNSRSYGRGMFWCGESIDVALSDGIAEADAIELIRDCASVFHNRHLYDEARQMLWEGLMRFPSAAQLWHRMGITAWYDDDPINALAYLACARAYGHPAARVAHPRGQVLMELGEYETAIRELDIAIADPLSSLSQGYAYSCKAYALFFTGRPDEAALAEQEALDRAPNNAWHYYRKGMIESFWQPEPAKKHLEMALKLDSPPLDPGRRKRVKALLRTLKGV